jgi:hypothetical protein
MTSIIKSLLGKKNKKHAVEEIEALDRATQVLQFRVAQMTAKSSASPEKEAA